MYIYISFSNKYNIHAHWRTQRTDDDSTARYDVVYGMAAFTATTNDKNVTFLRFSGEIWKNILW